MSDSSVSSSCLAFYTPVFIPDIAGRSRLRPHLDGVFPEVSSVLKVAPVSFFLSFYLAGYLVPAFTHLPDVCPQYRATDEMIHDSSDEDYEGPTLHHAFDAMFENNDGFPFVVGGAMISVTAAHPSAIQIFQLWQIYIQNVNPLLKLSHITTLQGQIISAGANTAKIPKPLEALMFSIYFSAITSLTDEEVQATFGEDKAVLLTKYHNATQQSLVNAGFMRSTELMVLQALLLYLVRHKPSPPRVSALLNNCSYASDHTSTHARCFVSSE